MRILLVIYGSLDTLSGGYLYDRTLVGYLEKKGHQVRVFSQSRRNAYLANVLDNLDVALVQEAATWNPDCIIQDELNHPSLFLMNPRLRKATSAPLIGMIHHLKSLEAGGMLERTAARLIERIYLGGLDGFICNSRFTRGSVEEALGSGGGRTHAIAKPYVIALPGKDRLSSVPEPPAGNGAERDRHGAGLRILFLGNVIRRKGLHVLINALALVSASSTAWSLAIAGNETLDEKYTASLKATIRKSGMQDRVRWLGTVTDAQLPGLFKEHDLLAVPSQCEGFGIVYAEAMSFGLPVIAGALGGAAEIVDEGRDGYLIPYGDASGLASILAGLLGDAEGLEGLASQARLKSARLPSWDESMERIEKFLVNFPKGRDAGMP